MTTNKYIAFLGDDLKWYIRDASGNVLIQSYDNMEEVALALEIKMLKESEKENF